MLQSKIVFIINNFFFINISINPFFLNIIIIIKGSSIDSNSERNSKNDYPEEKSDSEKSYNSDSNNNELEEEEEEEGRSWDYK